MWGVMFTLVYNNNFLLAVTSFRGEMIFLFSILCFLIYTTDFHQALTKAVECLSVISRTVVFRK